MKTPTVTSRTVAALAAGTLTATAFTVAFAPGAIAQTAEEFYAANDLTIVVGTDAGGGYDAYGRLVAEFLGDHIPGNPSVIVENLGGAGGRRATQYIYSVAPHDGSAIALLLQSFAMDTALGTTPGVENAGSFTGIGRLTANYELAIAWADTGIETFNDTLTDTVQFGSTGAGSASGFVPRMLNDIEGAQYEIIAGYQGTAPVRQALESGEVDAMMSGLAGLRATNPDWLSEGKVNVLWQLSNTPSPDYPDVVTIGTLGQTDVQKQMFQLVAGAAEIGRAMVAPPDVPEDRIAALRQGFSDMLEDPDFLAAAAERNLEIDPVDGETLQGFITAQSEISPEVVELTRSYVVVK